MTAKNKSVKQISAKDLVNLPGLNKDVFIGIMEEILREMSERKSVLPHYSGFERFMARILPAALKKWLITAYLLHIEHNQKTMVIEGDTKYWSVDFLAYIMKNMESISFPLEYFSVENDRREVIKFIRNKLLCAVSSKLSEERLFDKTDSHFMKLYPSFQKNNIMKIRGEKVQVKIGKTQFVLPKRQVDVSCLYHQHGLDELPASVKKRAQNKVFIDAGAFIGDSLVVLDGLRPAKILALEPDEINHSLLKETIAMNGLKHVEARKYGLGAFEGKIKFSSTGSADSYVSEFSNSKVDVRTIDSIQKETKSEVGLIKMDIEGFEANAILGGKETITKYKPILIICLYHTGKDFFEIPKMIKEWVPEYAFRFLNLNHAHPFAERVLLAYLK